ncbi:MAG TPA: oligosaccharide flippase family protein [Methylomirabilota bacterium]|jgi:O-antigen/teichoic acid export membrane protein|nr:oligosaccharide flippase family protein [Methylomirabilota bacterium]
MSDPGASPTGAGETLSTEDAGAPGRPRPRLARRDGGSLSSRTLWLMVAKTVGFACAFALPLLLVRRLSQHEFGLYKQIFLIVGTAALMLPLGFGTSSAFYFLPRERERQGAVVLNVLIFNVGVGLLGLVALLAWPGLLALIFGDVELIPFAPMIGVLILLLIVSAAPEFLAIANQETTIATGFILLSQLSRVGLLLGAALLVGTVRSLVWASIAHASMLTVTLLLYQHSRWRGFWRRVDWSMMREQLAYALPLGGAVLLAGVQLDLHNYVVSHRFGPAAYAVYAVGCFEFPLIMILSESATTVLIPHVGALQKAGQRREILAVTARATRKLALVFFPMYALLLVTGADLITFLFTPQYRASWPVFAINLALLPLSAVPYDPIVRAYANQRFFMLCLRVITFSLSAVALWFATARFGLVGAISVVVATAVVERLVIFVRLGRLLRVTRNDVVLLADTGKVALAAAAAGIITALVHPLLAETRPIVVLVVCGVVFTALYAAAIAALRILTPDERAMIGRPLATLYRRAAPGPV